MDLVALSDADFDEVEVRFTQFHYHYTPFFQNRTKSVAKPAKDYLHGQLFLKQQMNMVQYCREVPLSEYEAMQHFISSSPWEDRELLKQLQHDVYHLLVEEPSDGALILDESGIEKQGKMSVGVERQYCGRLGKVENCQVGVYLGYSNPNHASLVDYRLYLPESWLLDSDRRLKCGVPINAVVQPLSPQEIEFQTKAQLGLEMIRTFKASGLEFGFVCMDCHYGEQPWLLKILTEEDICYMADIPYLFALASSR